MKHLIFCLISTVIFTGCGSKDLEPDAYGNFMATEIIVSAQVAGEVLQKNISEGDNVRKGQIAYHIDSLQVFLKRSELIARQNAVEAKRANINAQLAVVEEQQRTLRSEIKRFEELVGEGASPQKQLDDLENKNSLFEKQKQQIQTNYASLDAERAAINASIEAVDDLLSRSIVLAPGEGTILETYVEAGETVVQGRPLFKMANLNTMELKAYFSGRQLASLKLGDEVSVFTDDENGTLKDYVGTITWISSNAEFTPKIIQTREERVALVYAVKLKVVNDGTLHINMPGEVVLKKIADK